MRKIVYTAFIGLSVFTLGCARSEWTEVSTLPDGTKEYIGKVEKEGSLVSYEVKTKVTGSGNSLLEQEVTQKLGGNISELHTTLVLNCDTQQAAIKEMKAVGANSKELVLPTSKELSFQELEPNSPVYINHFPFVCGKKTASKIDPLRNSNENWQKITSIPNQSIDYVDLNSLNRANGQVSIHVKTVFDKNFKGNRQLSASDILVEQVAETRALEIYDCEKNLLRLGLIEEYGASGMRLSRFKEGSTPTFDPIPPNSEISKRKNFACTQR